MHDQITAMGWAWHGSCNCTKKGNLYKKNGLNLKHFYVSEIWELRKKNRVIAKGDNSNLLSKLREYEQMEIH